MSTKFHFWNDPTDPTEILFNDPSILQLFKAYGKTLRLDLRAADGLPEKKDGIDNLTPVAADIAGPFYDALKAMVNAGLLPCVGAIAWNYGKKTFDAKLRPLMAYTLDVVTDPPTSTAPGKAVTPLFRVQFSTGKYASMDELIKDVAANKVRHRALTSQIVLPAGTVAPDQSIQDALTAAGEQTLPADLSTRHHGVLGQACRQADLLAARDPDQRAGAPLADPDGAPAGAGRQQRSDLHPDRERRDDVPGDEGAGHGEHEPVRALAGRHEDPRLPQRHVQPAARGGQRRSSCTGRRASTSTSPR